MNLHTEFIRIKKNHLEALRNTSARTVLGSSVIRVFQKGTKDQLVNALLRINVDQLNSIKTQNKFQKWFESELSKLARIIKGPSEFSVGHTIYCGIIDCLSSG